MFYLLRQSPPPPALRFALGGFWVVYPLMMWGYIWLAGFMAPATQAPQTLLFLCLLSFVCGLAILAHKGLWQQAAGLLYKADWRVWGCWALVIFCVANAGHLKIVRQVVFSHMFLSIVILFTPLLIRLLKAAHIPSAKIAAVFIYLSFLFYAIPGFYAPPFYRGIEGWTLEAFYNPTSNAPQYLHTNGFTLQNMAGEDLWFNPALAAPSAAIYRYDRAALKISTFDANYYGADWWHRYRTIRQDQLQYLYRIYQHHWPLLKQNIYPHQRHLGVMGYPAHNPTRHTDYTSMPPEEVRFISQVAQQRDIHTGEVINHQTFATYDTHTNKLLMLYNPRSGKLETLESEETP